MATAGLVCGVVFGVIMINIAARKGKTLYVRQPSQIPREVKIGYVEPEKRTSIGSGVTFNDVIDPFGFALCWCGLICTLGYMVRNLLIAIHPILSNIPWFACCLILSKMCIRDRYNTLFIVNNTPCLIKHFELPTNLSMRKCAKGANHFVQNWN